MHLCFLLYGVSVRMSIRRGWRYHALSRISRIPIPAVDERTASNFLWHCWPFPTMSSGTKQLRSPLSYLVSNRLPSSIAHERISMVSGECSAGAGRKTEAIKTGDDACDTDRPGVMRGDN